MTTDLSLTELGDGVYAWLLPGGETGVANAGVVIDDDGITVIDTLMVRSQWEPFAPRSPRSTCRCGAPFSPTRTSTTSGGTKAFPHAAVYASPSASAALDEDMPIDGYKKFMPAFEAEFDDLAELGTRDVTHEIDGAAQLTERIEVLPANGHTDGDLLILIADEDVMFAGDICFFGVTPLAFQGDPAAGPTCSTRWPSWPT